MSHQCCRCCRCCGQVLDSSFVIPNQTKDSLAAYSQKLHSTISNFDLVLDLRIWKKSQWIQKGACYALLHKSYDLLDSFDARYQLYLATDYYNQTFQTYLVGFKNYFKLYEVQQVMYLINQVFIPHLSDMQLFGDTYFKSDKITLGIINQPTRFQQLCNNLKDQIKYNDGGSLSNKDIVQYAKDQWKNISSSFKKQLRQGRLEQLQKQLSKSLLYQQKKLDVMKEINELNNVEIPQSQGFRGRMLKQLLGTQASKGDTLEIFTKYNRKLLEQRKQL